MFSFYTHGWGMWFSWIIGFILLIFVIWIVFQALFQNDKRNKSPDKTTLDIIKERYAKGEIDKDEFEQLKKDLM